jgi:K+-sensing histidine kinase KdpD
LGQVLVNIIGNAVKFTFKGKVSINVTANERDSEIRVEVRDTGKGIEKLHAVGNFFGNLDIVEKVNQNGIGFGITISKKLMHKLGGEIFLQNAYNGQFGQVH